MSRLFAGTPWDRPPTCDRCGAPESDCRCAPLKQPASHVPPHEQTARIRVEKRPKGKTVSVVRGLDGAGNHLTELAATLKTACGTGGTVKDGVIEIQGQHLERIETMLVGLGYRVKRG